MSQRFRCPTCQREGIFLLGLYICGYCQYAAVEWQYLKRVQDAEMLAAKDAVEGKRQEVLFG